MVLSSNPTSKGRSKGTTKVSSKSRSAPGPSSTTAMTLKTTTTTKTDGAVVAMDCENLLIDLIPFFDEYQTYCIKNNNATTPSSETDYDILDNNNKDHEDESNYDKNKIKIRNRLVQKILTLCNMNKIISEMKNLSVIDENGENETSMVHQFAESERMKMITECFLHIMDTAISALIPPSSSSSSNNRNSNNLIAGSTAILDLLMSVVVDWMMIQQKHFNTSNDDEGDNYYFDTCVKSVVSYLARYSSCPNDTIRIVSVRALCFVAEYLGSHSDADKDDAFIQVKLDLLDTIQQALVPRFTDKVVAVRCATIQACFTNSTWTSNPLRNDPDLLLAVQWMVQHDPSPNNRMIAIRHAPINRRTIEYLIPRIRDTKVNVRIAAIMALSKAMESDNDNMDREDDDETSHFILQSRHLAEIISTGYTDRCSTTKDAIRRMVCTSWIKSVGYNPITLLRWINVLDYPTIASTLLEIWYDVAFNNPIWSQEVMSVTDQLSVREGLQNSISHFTISDAGGDSNTENAIECLFIARNMLHLTPSVQDKDTLWIQIVPDVPSLCQVIEDLTSQLVQVMVSNMESTKNTSNDSSNGDEEKWIFLCVELLQLAVINVVTMEEGSRRILKNTMIDLLSNVVTPDDLLEGCVKALTQLSNHDDHRGQEGGIDLDILPIIELLTQTTSSSDNELLVLHTSIRIVSLITLFLETRNTTKQLSSDAMKSFVTYVRPTITSDNNLLRQAGVRVWGLLGLCLNSVIETEISNDEYTKTLLEIARNVNEGIEIRIQSMFALTDWCMIQFRCHGVTSAISEIMESLCYQIDRFLELPTTLSQGTLCCVAEMCTKLLICMFMDTSTTNNYTQTARIRLWLARLVVVYFDYETDHTSTASEDNNDENNQVGSPVRLQQLLSVFFSTIAVVPAVQKCGCFLIESVSALLLILQRQDLSKTKQKTGKSSSTSSKRAIQWTRSIDFIVSTVSKILVRNVEQQVVPVTDTAVATIDEEDADNSDTNLAETEAEIVNDSTVEPDATMSSPGLQASVQVATFLSEQNSMINVNIRRALCKWIGTQMTCIDIENEQWSDLSRFKAILEELVENDGIDDASSRRTLEPVLKLLSDVESENEDDDEDVSDVDVDISLLSNDMGKIHIVADGNENDTSEFKTSTVTGMTKHSNNLSTSNRSRASRRLRPSN